MEFSANYVSTGSLWVHSLLYDFITNEAIPGTGIQPASFWPGFAALITRYGPENVELLAERVRLQQSIDDWHRQRRGTQINITQYHKFLYDIGYVQQTPGTVAVATSNVDEEIAHVAGPQLVVPATNARYALNAVNARWGSLYNALYGSNVIPETGGLERGAAFNARRGRLVIARGRSFLDDNFPLATGSHTESCGYQVKNGHLAVKLSNRTVSLKDGSQFVALRGSPERPIAVLLRNNNLHVEISIDALSPMGRIDNAGIADLIIEAAITTIIDGEDSVAAVDVEDKVLLFRNWLGLMKGTLTETVEKNDQKFVRRLAEDRRYNTVDGDDLVLHGRALMLIRNVGSHLDTDIVLDVNGNSVPETIVDLVVGSVCALHDLRRASGLRNSRAGSVYVVKPKLHGAEEVSHADALFSATEDLLGMDRYTLKMGIMDEERRTSVNLAACIAAAENRVFFINTGFLDRTGDEIHTSMEAGPMIRKNDMRSAIWMNSYEDRSVGIGITCGLPGRGQIGKGMWAAPDAMAEMLEEKIAHPRAGASTAWVPSPTAATLHALHYHAVDVAARQQELRSRPVSPLNDLLTIPVADPRNWTADDIEQELENNAQSILGYVVRWVDRGIGCSKVPDTHNVALMEDRATLRISAQHVSNWLLHGLVTAEQVMGTLRRMAIIVDRQNAMDRHYKPMAPDYNGAAFKAACDLVFKGRTQPNGYTEFILYNRRREAKARA